MFRTCFAFVVKKDKSLLHVRRKGCHKLCYCQPLPVCTLQVRVGSIELNFNVSENIQEYSCHQELKAELTLFMKYLFNRNHTCVTQHWEEIVKKSSLSINFRLGFKEYNGFGLIFNEILQIKNIFRRHAH